MLPLYLYPNFKRNPKLLNSLILFPGKVNDYRSRTNSRIQLGLQDIERNGVWGRRSEENQVL